MLAQQALSPRCWVYDISATDQHLAPTYWLLDTGMRRSVVQRAKRIEVPPLDDAGQIARGAARYRDLCVQWHGAPGVAPEAFALGLTPTPANLARTARAWRPAELFWTIKQGIKMTGMPAWRFRMDYEEIWAIVAFLRVMPALTPEEYRRISEQSAATSQEADRAAVALARTPDAERAS